jgi:anti-sigma B factor antagonist
MRLYGEFDLAARDRFQAAFTPLAQDGLRELVVDLAGLSFIDSIGIRCLLEAKGLADRDGFQMFVALPADGQVRKVLALTGMEEVFSVPVGHGGTTPPMPA